MGVSLTDYLAQLSYAAGAGADKVASSVTSSGNIQAKTGIAVRTPGPALRSMLAGPRQQSIQATTSPNTGRVVKVANRMAAETLRQGAELLSEGK